MSAGRYANLFRTLDAQRLALALRSQPGINDALNSWQSFFGVATNAAELCAGSPEKLVDDTRASESAYLFETTHEQASFATLSEAVRYLESDVWRGARPHLYRVGPQEGSKKLLACNQKANGFAVGAHEPENRLAEQIRPKLATTIVDPTSTHFTKTYAQYALTALAQRVTVGIGEDLKSATNLTVGEGLRELARTLADPHDFMAMFTDHMDDFGGGLMVKTGDILYLKRDNAGNETFCLTATEDELVGQDGNVAHLECVTYHAGQPTRLADVTRADTDHIETLVMRLTATE